MTARIEESQHLTGLRLLSEDLGVLLLGLLERLLEEVGI